MMEKEKVRQFQNLFETRQDVYAIQFEKTGRTVGYHPAKTKNGSYRSPTFESYLDHLTGRQTMGAYIPLPQETGAPVTPFICLDLDGDRFPEKERLAAALFQLAEVCRVNEIPGYVEVSRSGEGYHLWIFLQAPVEAWKARRIATRLVEIARVDGGTVEIFPKQDWLDEDRNGLGNLIALPLDGRLVEQQKTVFVDSYSLVPVENQWSLLENIVKLDDLSLRALTREWQIDLTIPRKRGHSNPEYDRLAGLLPCAQRMAEGVAEGCRDVAMFTLAKHLRTKGLPESMVLSILKDVNSRNSPPLPETVVERKVRSTFEGRYSSLGCDERLIAPFCDKGRCRAAKKRSSLEVSTDLQPEQAPKYVLALTKEAYPENGFFHEFMEYASPLTDGPDEFLFGAALAGVAGVIGNNIYLPFGPGRLYPNLWVLLLAKSSIFRKSTCITIMRQTVERLEEAVVMPDQSTPEAFLEDLSENPSGLYVLYELGAFLKNLERSYMRGFKEDLAQLYDCPPIFRRRRKNQKSERVTIEVRNPCLSLVSASTIDWFLNSVGEGDAEGGFLPRFFYIPAEVKEKEKLILPPRADSSRVNQLVSMLQKIREKKGTILIPEQTDAYEMYQNWATKIEEKVQAHNQEPYLAAFLTRLEIGALKIATIIEASLYEIEDNHILSPASMDYGVRIAGWLTQNVIYLLEEKLAFTPAEKKKMKILEVIKQKGIVSHSELLQRSHLSARDFHEIIATLIGCGKIKEVESKKLRGPTGTAYQYIAPKTISTSSSAPGNSMIL